MGLDTPTGSLSQPERIGGRAGLPFAIPGNQQKCSPELLPLPGVLGNLPKHDFACLFSMRMVSPLIHKDNKMIREIFIPKLFSEPLLRPFLSRFG